MLFAMGALARGVSEHVSVRGVTEGKPQGADESDEESDDPIWMV